jgi:hypothetical protein
VMCAEGTIARASGTIRTTPVMVGRKVCVTPAA